MGRQRKPRGRSRSRRTNGQWGGLQWPLSNVPSNGLFQDLSNNLGTEDHARTVVGVRGYVHMANSGSDAATAGVQCGLKLISVELDDGFNITGDAQGIDANLEDIQARQLWTYHTNLEARGANADAGDTDRVTIEVNVKVKIRMPSTAKQAFGLLMDASATNRLQSVGYLRAYYVFS